MKAISKALLWFLIGVALFALSIAPAIHAAKIVRERVKQEQELAEAERQAMAYKIKVLEAENLRLKVNFSFFQGQMRLVGPLHQLECEKAYAAGWADGYKGRPLL